MHVWKMDRCTSFNQRVSLCDQTCYNIVFPKGKLSITDISQECTVQLEASSLVFIFNWLSMNETKQKHSDTKAPWKHKMESESWSQRATLHIQGCVQLFKDGGLHKISADGVAVAIPISNKSVLIDSPVETNKDSSGLK